jgi:hypothetical protein
MSQFSELRCGKYYFRVNFVAGNSNKLQKLGFGMKNQLSPQCVHNWAKGTGYTSMDNARTI